MPFTPNVNPTFVRQPVVGVTAITTTVGAAQALVTVLTGGSSNGTKIIALNVTALSSVAQDVRWWITASGTSHPFGTASVPVSAGVNSVSTNPSVNLFSQSVTPLPVDSDGNPFIFLRSSQDSLDIQTTINSSQWAAGNFLHFIAFGGDF